MSLQQSAYQIKKRFTDEQERIDQYTQFLRSNSIIHDEQVLELNRILKRVHIDPLPTRSFARITKPYSQEETDLLIDSIRKADPEIYQAILGHEQFLDNIPRSDYSGPAEDYIDNLSEWIDYVLARLPSDPEKHDDDAILQNAMLEAENEGINIPTDALRELLVIAIEHAKYVRVRQQVDAMVYAREQFEDIELLAHIAKPDAEINALRQGFLLLLIAFDAAVFDLARIAFRNKLFQVISSFGKQEKISLEEFGEAGSFEALRNQIVEKQLRKRYTKDLLGLLQSLGLTLVDTEKGDSHARLIELVMRRNVHVHNRGVIDEYYLEIDPHSKKPKYNLYNLKLGSIGIIDMPYLEMANRLCQNCVSRIFDWAVD